MSEPLIIALREALQCAFILLLIRAYLPGENKNRYFIPALSGVMLALFAGLALGVYPRAAELLPSDKDWAFFRHLTEVAIFYAGFALITTEPGKPNRPMSGVGIFLLGFAVFFFEARSLGSMLLDAGLRGGNLAGVFSYVLIGLLIGFLPLALVLKRFDMIRLPRTLDAATLLIAVGTVKFAMGGLGEAGETGIVNSLAGGFGYFLESARGHVQSALMIEGHPFLPTPFAGPIDLLFGIRTSAALTAAFLAAPPLASLLVMFGRPSPPPLDIGAPAEHKLSAAFFRKDILYRALPVLVSLVAIIVLIQISLMKGALQ